MTLNESSSADDANIAAQVQGLHSFTASALKIPLTDTQLEAAAHIRMGPLHAPTIGAPRPC